MNKLFEVIKHEFKLTAANKTFVIMTILGPFLIFAVAVLPSILSTRTGGIQEGTVIGVVAGDSALIPRLEAAFNDAGIGIDAEGTLDEHKTKVLEGESRGLLVIPRDYRSVDSIRYFSQSGTEIVLTETLRSLLGNIIVAERMAAEGIDAQRVASLSRWPDLDIQKLDRSGESEQKSFLNVLLTALAFVMLLYMTTLLYGQMIGRSVVVEKTSKTVEIMLSSIRPLDLLFGKLLGRGIAGLLQYAIWISVALLLIQILGPAIDLTTSISLEPSHFGYLILFFILAFLLYSSIFAALGAGAEDEQHLGQLSWPLIMFLVVPMVLISPIVMNPGSLFVAILSYFPLTSSIVMFVRVLIGNPKPWEILVCIAILICTIGITVLLSAKIFRVGILMTGKRMRLKEIIRWVRY